MWPCRRVDRWVDATGAALAVLQDADRALTAREVRDLAGLDTTTTRVVLTRSRRTGHIARVWAYTPAGRYERHYLLPSAAC